jgi:hypothetical protein
MELFCDRPRDQVMPTDITNTQTEMERLALQIQAFLNNAAVPLEQRQEMAERLQTVVNHFTELTGALVPVITFRI